MQAQDAVAVERRQRLELDDVHPQRTEQVADERPRPRRGHLQQAQAGERRTVDRRRRAGGRRLPRGPHPLVDHRQAGGAERPHRSAPVAVRRRHGADEVAGSEVFVGQRLGAGHHLAHGPRCAHRQVEDLLLGLRRVPIADAFPDLVDAHAACRPSGEQRIVDPLGDAVQRALHVPVDVAEAAGDDEPVPARQRPTGERGDRERTGRWPAPAGDESIGEVQLATGHQARRPRHVDVADAGHPQRGERAHRGDRPGLALGLPAGQAYGRLAGIALHPDQSGSCLGEHVVLDRTRAGVDTERGHRHQQGRIDAGRLGDDDVEVAWRGRRRVELAGVEVDVQRRQSVERHVVDLLGARRITARRLHLAHGRAEHRQQPPGVRPGDAGGQLQHAQPGKGRFDHHSARSISMPARSPAARHSSSNWLNALTPGVYAPKNALPPFGSPSLL